MNRVLPWVISVLSVIISVGVIVSALRKEAGLKAEHDREIEARELVARNQIVAIRHDKESIERELANVIENNNELQKALESARKATLKSKVIRVVEASTGPLATAYDQEINERNKASEVRCLLKDGDIGEIRVTEVELKTKLDNKVLVGVAEAWRLTPEPSIKLFGGPFDANATKAVELAPEPDKPKLEWWQHELIGIAVGVAAVSALVATR